MISAAWQKSMKDLWRLMVVVFVILLLIYGASGTYSISRNELGVHFRFGRILSSSIPSGIHYALPWPIDRIEKVPVREVRSLTIQTFTDDSEDAYLFSRATGLDSYCITGDNNILNISFVIQYTLDNPAEYLTGTLAPETFLKHSTERVIERTLTALPVDTILTHGKQSIAENIKTEVNRLLAAAHSGMHITFAELVNVSPPSSVQAYFDDVVNAKIDRERLISEAESYRNEHLPRAQGRAHEISELAHAYQNQVISEAEGNTQRFNSQLSAYLKAQNLVHNRLWLSTLQKVLYNTGQTYLIDTQKNAPRANLKIMIP